MTPNLKVWLISSLGMHSTVIQCHHQLREDIRTQSCKKMNICMVNQSQKNCSTRKLHVNILYIYLYIKIYLKIVSCFNPIGRFIFTLVYQML